MASVEGSNEIEFVDRVADLRTDRGGHARRVDLVHLVYLVCSVYLVYALSLVQPNRRDRPDRPNNGLLMLADCLSIQLVALYGRRCRTGRMHRQGASRSSCLCPRDVFSCVWLRLVGLARWTCRFRASLERHLHDIIHRIGKDEVDPLQNVLGNLIEILLVAFWKNHGGEFGPFSR